MSEDRAQLWWRSWLDAEIARRETALIAAPMHERFEIWRRLDLLHALRGRAPVQGAPPVWLPQCAAAPGSRQRRAGDLVLAGAVFGAALVRLLVAGLGLPE